MALPVLLLGGTLAGCTGSVSDLNPTGEPAPVERPPVDPGEPLQCEGVTADPGETVVSRLTRTEYLRTVNSLFGVDVEGAANRLPFEIRAPSSTTATAQTVDFMHVRAYDEVGQAVAAALGDFAGDYTSCTDMTEACQREFINNLASHAFRRPARPEEVDRFLPIFAVVDSEGDGFDVAAPMVLRAVLQSPQFLYHLEDQRGTDVQAVDPYALANRIAYLVWHAPPDARLLEAAANDALGTPEAIEAQVRRMVGDARTRSASLTFVDDWVDLSRLEQAVSGVDDALKVQMRQEVEGFVEHVLWEENGGLIDLLGSDQTFATPDLAEIYGIESAGSGLQRYDLSAIPERRGLLTQPGILASHANGNRPAIVSRGVFVLRAVTCRDIPNPPATVDTNLTELPETASERDKSGERLARPICGNCHQTFDPLAYALDPFDGEGRFRDEDDNGNPTQTDGWVPAEFGEFPEGDPRGIRVDYDDLDGLVEALVAAPYVSECMAEKPLIFAMRRPLDRRVLPDACAIQQVEESTRAAGGSYEDLLVAIATHPMFGLTRARSAQ
ncbi:MAG: DUF1592 domain-containing protein [Myxococcota bacterium]